ncbi:MAG TPA: PEP/pyruvate-binding domain-containing protein [Burkholderiales bacterium]|nr:PEP/pyruvate-binding domain-containing protein [Burkholderiales bacterium]
MESPFVLLPNEIAADSPVGGKAAALTAMTRAGLPVPPWFVVLPHAFHASVPRETAERLAHATSAAVAQSLFQGARLSDEATRQVVAALKQIGDDTDLFAVRSSAVEEDSTEFSFAGQLESFLFVAGGDVPSRIPGVWASGFSDRIVRYRQEARLDPVAGVPAVIVQRMVAGIASGVAFSADPVSGRRGVAVVAAVPGLGSALVSGEAAADTWRVDRDGVIGERHVETKERMDRAASGGAEGVVSVVVPAALATRPALDDGAIRDVAALARRAQAHFGRPQDIEWTLADAGLFLLQSRPITGLADNPDPDAPLAVWDNSNIVESYSGVTTPLTFSFARRAYEYVYREFSQQIRTPEAVIESHASVFAGMLGLIRGRVYYNLLNWYRLLSHIPGYTLHRKSLEQMLGMSARPPDEAIAVRERVTAHQRLRDTLRELMSLGALLVAFLTLERRIARFYRRVRETLGPGRPDLSGMRPDELVAYYRDLEAKLLCHWDAPVFNDFATMLAHRLLRKLCAAWIGEEGALSNDLLCGEEGMVSEEPARRVREMARLAADDTRLVDALCEHTPPTPVELSRSHPTLATALGEYLEKFGERCMEELKLESETLHDNPIPLLRAVGQYARNLSLHAAPSDVSAQEKVRERAENRVRAALAGRPLRRLAFAWVLATTRARVRARENLRFERTRAFGRARQIFIEVGRRLAALDLLADPRDVFYLELDELIGFVEGHATTADLKGLAAVRKTEFDMYRTTPAPAERFETRGIVYRGHAFAPSQPVEPISGESLRGLGCCPGVVRGPVRLVVNPKTATVRPGEILVAERTDPGWVMIFPAASGLLVERGSLLSHSAIVARELGLPAIVSLTGVTRWLKDGDWVEMNGATGLVVKLAVPIGDEAGAPR